MARILAALAAFLVLLLPGVAQGYDSYPELDETASWLALRPVTVHCLTEAETLADLNISFYGASAYVEITPEDRPADYTVFEYGLCERLHALYTGTWFGKYTLKGIAWAVLVITHESGHMRGWGWWKSEAKTNCWAARHTRYTALHLGPSVLAPLIVSRAMEWFRGQPPEYQLPGCKVPTP